jgi:hypothetical protein
MWVQIPPSAQNPVFTGFSFSIQLKFLRYDMHMSGQKWFNVRWIFVILLAILFIMIMGLNARLSEFFHLTSQKKEMQLRISNLESTQFALQTQIAYSSSGKSVEEWARTYERMIQPGDQVIIPLAPINITPEINYLATPTKQNSENWQIWWDLFFAD